MRQWPEIVQIVSDLQRYQGRTIAKMREILHRYEGDWILPVPEVPSEPKLPPLTPMLVAEAVDQMGMRASSVVPTVYIPAINPTKDLGVRSREYAQMRRRILGATYDLSKWQLGRRRYYRHLAAYHTCSITVVPDFKLGHPRVMVRDPLATYVEPRSQESLDPPEYVAYVTRFSGAHLRRAYPQLRAEVQGPIAITDQALMWEVVEWVDHEQLRYGLLGPVERRGPHIADAWRQAPNTPLSPAYPNKTGCCYGIVPQNVSLGEIVARLSSMLGNVDLQAKLTALDILAQEKAIFPDVYAIGNEGSQPRIIGGRWKDGREGDINLLSDVQTVGVLRTTPDQRTSQTIDRLERAFRVSTGLVPQMGGETYGALRTGRGMDALAGMAVDPRIQELHEISQAWMPHVNRAIFDCYKAHWGSKSFSMYSGWPGDRGFVDFVPSTHIERTENTVSYTIPGADVVQQTQILGSMLGAKVISRDTFRNKHPWVENAETEAGLIGEEELEDALRQSIMEKLLTGAMDMMLAVRIHEHIKKGKDIFDAVDAANKELQALQAAQPPDTPDGMTAPPQSMPGVDGGPGATQAPAPQMAPGIQTPPDAAQMRQLMQTMGGTRGPGGRTAVATPAPGSGY